MVFATYASAVILLAASIAVGRALWRLLGARGNAWVEPIVGFAILSLIASVGTRVLDSGQAAAIPLGVVIALAVAYLRGRIVDAEWLRVGLPVLAAAGLLASLPFIASARIGILGVGVNNDLASHLLWAEWLIDQPEPVPVGLAAGYPIGPHSLAAALGGTLGFSMVEALSGLLVAVAGMTALASLAALAGLRPALRIVSGALVALPYMVASALAIGGFKETVMAMYLVGFALLLWRLERDWPGDRATWVSVGIVPAGILTAYSYPGLYWAVAAAGLLAAYGLFRAWRAGALARELRRAAPLAAIAGIVFVALGALEVGRAVHFGDVSGVGKTIEGSGKLRESVSAFETLGVWPNSDFLAGAPGLDAHLLFGLFGLVCLIGALVWWLRHGGWAIPLALAGAGVIYLGALDVAGLYVQSKALAVPAPLVMLVVLQGLLAPRGRDDPLLGPRWLRPALAAAFIALAGYSSFLALRNAVVAPNEHSEELAELQRIVGNDWVLSLTSDRYTDYQLGTTRVASPARNAQQVVISRRGKDYRLPLDFDSVEHHVVNAFDWVLTTAGEYRSAPTANLELAASTPSYQLWHRVGPVPPNDRIFGEEASPGKLLRCRAGDVAIAQRRKNARSAAVLMPAPVVGKRRNWEPSKRLGPGGQEVSQTIELSPGTWDLSLQYHSPVVGLEVEAAGESFELPGAIEGAVVFRLGQGPYWPAGRITVSGGPVEITVRSGDLNLVQRLLGVDRDAVIGNVAAVRVGSRMRIPFARACGKYVDHYYVFPPGRPKKTIKLPPDPELVAEQTEELRQEREGR